MIKFLNAESIQSHAWSQLVNESPTATFFQTKACYDFYASLSFLKPVLFGVSENDKLVGLLCGYLIADGGIIKQFFSKRVIVPGGLLLNPSISDKALEVLLTTVKNNLKSQAIYIEIRNYVDFKSYIPALKASGYDYAPHLNFHLPTPSYDAVWEKLSKSKRRQIKSSLKVGAVVQEAVTIDDIHEYYHLISDLYKNKIKLPLFPIEFFEKLLKSNFAKIFVVKIGGRVISGITCVLLDNKTIYEWFVCGEECDNKNIHPSVLATWAGIEYGINNGFEYFDFMGAGKPNTGYGVFEFKSKFGGELFEHGRFLCVNNRFLYSLGKLAIQLLQR
ncbi:MAG: lipid II:glycine glycyltransferase FemX [Paludibacter sp.]